ncbi:MAG TPA: Flp pilus assembly protein CpaB [Terriglobales bacterium]|nr:Flp pilus assembly protein CpaB [Terriglobales bacterium]
MNRSRLLMIGGLALAIGLLASYYVFNMLKGSTRGKETMVMVVVAANDIQIGSKLADHDLALAAFPQSSVPPGAFGRIAQVRQRGVVIPISKGDFILPNKLAAEDAGAGLPSMIPQGMRAISVRVNDVVSVAGFVQPGTHVDVLATGLPGSSGNEAQTTTVLENVAVIAVGRSLLDRMMSGETQNAAVITLLVSPGDAQKLTLASQEGRIQLALRNPLDIRKEEIAPARASSLSPGAAAAVATSKPKLHKVTEKVTPQPPPAPYQIEMIRGGKREETKFKQDETH